MTISLDDAISLANKMVAALGATGDDDFALMGDKTIEIESGWVFFYNTREFIEIREPILALAGNGPIFVSREGDVRKLPSAVSWETAIKFA